MASGSLDRLKIAIVGSHPDTWHRAPFKDRDWTIWGFSRKNYQALPRFDKWFELHPQSHYHQYQTQVPGYVDWLFENEEVVLHGDFPHKEILAEFGPYFFSHGQIGWLLAYAITLAPKTIGLWGIDGQPSNEYCGQRPEIWYFTSIAKYRGIEVIAPDSPKLLEPDPSYAFS